MKSHCRCRFLFCAERSATSSRDMRAARRQKRSLLFTPARHGKNRAEYGTIAAMHARVWEDELSAAVMRAVHGHALAAVDGDGAVRVPSVPPRQARRARLPPGVGGGRIEHNGDFRLRLRMCSITRASLTRRSTRARSGRRRQAAELKGEGRYRRESAQLDDVRGDLGANLGALPRRRGLERWS